MKRTKTYKDKIKHDLVIKLWGVSFPQDKKGRFDPDATKIAEILTPIFLELFLEYLDAYKRNRVGWVCPHGVFITWEAYKSVDKCENYHPNLEQKFDA